MEDSCATTPPVVIPIPSVQDVYDRYSILYARQYTSPSKTVNEFIACLPNKAFVLEVGCGPGIDANHFAQHGLHVIATDISSGMIDIAKQQFPTIDFRVQDMRYLDFQDALFDGIYAESSLIHIPKHDVLQVLQRFYRVLKPGGVLAMGLQEGTSEEVIRPAPFAPDESVFLNVMSHAETQQLLAEAGFAIIKDYCLAPKRQGQHPFMKRKLFAQKVV